MNKLTFTCWGPTHGECGITHATLEAAERCHNKHGRAMRRLGRYTDRDVYEGAPGRTLEEWAKATPARTEPWRAKLVAILRESEAAAAKARAN